MSTTSGHMGAQPNIRTFSSFEDATAAQQALASAGVPRDLMEVRVLDDEAGPVQGNFIVGNGATTHGGAPGGVRTGPEVPYEQNFREVVRRGAYMLVVQAPESNERALELEAVLARFDSVAPPHPA